MPFPGVLKEQRASYDDGLYPGNVFHPDFQHGRPAFISSCASCAGVAAAGEVAKDKKHLAAVEKVGSDFFSCGNIWSLDTFCSKNFTEYS